MPAATNGIAELWLPQASYPNGNFSDTSCYRPNSKGSTGLVFTFHVRTENQDLISKTKAAAAIQPECLRNEWEKRREVSIKYLDYVYLL
uniref:CUB domain-containing protein n=1 Tax=Syphacia muris TaxID=451379 RepID=A0A0N5AY16_9BILA